MGTDAIHGVLPSQDALAPMSGFRLDRAGSYPFGLPAIAGFRDLDQSPVACSQGAIPSVVRPEPPIVLSLGSVRLCPILGLCF